MLFVLATAAMALPAGSPAPRTTSSVPCERATASFATGTGQVPSVRRLDQMPAARQILGVLHQEDGCLRPIVVRAQVGQPPRLYPSLR